MSRGLPFGADDQLRLTLPSQASQRARAAEMRRAEAGASAAPGPAAGSARSSMPMVTTTCGLTVRRIGRSPAASALSAQLHEGVAELLGVGCGRSPVGPIGLHASTPAPPRTFSPPTASSSPRIDRLPSACLTIDSERPSVESGSVPSGSQPCQVVVHAPGQLARAGGWRRSRPARASTSPPDRRPAPARRPGARRWLTGAISATCSAVDATVGERGGRCRQVFQRAAPWRPAGARPAGDSRACPRSQDCMVFCPSCSAASGQLALPARCGRPARRADSATASNRTVRASTCGPNIDFRSSSASAVQRALQTPPSASPEPSEHMCEY